MRAANSRSWNLPAWTILGASLGQREANGLMRYMAAELSQSEVEAAREKARNWKPAK